MLTLTALTLLFNGLMLMLALGSLFILVIFLQDTYRVTNIYYGLFMLSMLVWASGSFLARITAQAAADDDLTRVGLWLLELGFGGACISAYILGAILTDIRRVFVWPVVVGGVVVVVIYQALLVALGASLNYEISDSGTLSYSFPQINGVIYFLFAGGLLLNVWRNLVKIRRPAMRLGLLVFGVGTLLSLFSPRLRTLGLAEDLSTFAAVMITYSMIQSHIVEPLVGRTRQVDVVRDVGLAITSQVRIGDVLRTIAGQAVELLQVRGGSAIYLEEGDAYVLRAVHGLPERYVDEIRVEVGQGVVGQVASTREGRLISNYQREWKGDPDLPIALATFGSVVCVPLIFGEDVVGVLLVVEAPDARLFEAEDMQLLELLAPQAAVAIANSRLFEQEWALKNEREAAKAQLETVLASTSNPVIAVDRRLKVLFANPAAATLITPDKARDDLIGSPLLEFISRGLLPPDLRSFVRALRHQKSFVYELSFQNRFYLCHVAQLDISDGGWVAVLNDVTTLKEVDRLKSQMIRMTSHDLKNPLFATMNYLELLEEDGATIFSPEMHHNVNAIWTQLDRMQRLINGILDLEKVQGGVPVMEICDLRHVVMSVVEGMEDLAAARKLALTIDIEEYLPLVVGDPQLLAQALTNLIDNAIKFTLPGGSICVRGYAHEGAVILSVQDTGIGIAPEAQAKVFDRFFRVKQGRAKDDASSGLGLSLVKAIVDNHNGRIWLTS
ncbi:MAG: GAF domain-containing sensor histidine kinase, partial [Chloroflexi bacterium]|nr:GAF domain-containing sensor histidine kinase [Chloroflexota bacterium]